VTTQQYRSLVALGNLVVFALIGWVGFRSFFPGEVPPSERADPTFDPLAYKLEDQEIESQTVAQRYGVAWSELDRPKPVAPRPAATPRPSVEQVRTPQDLSSKYELVYVQSDPDNPRFGSCIIQSRRGRGKQRNVGVGDELDGYTVLEIEIRRTNDETEAVVTVDDRGREDQITLRREHTER